MSSFLQAINDSKIILDELRADIGRNPKRESVDNWISKKRNSRKGAKTQRTANATRGIIYVGQKIVGCLRMSASHFSAANFFALAVSRLPRSLSSYNPPFSPRSPADTMPDMTIERLLQLKVGDRLRCSDDSSVFRHDVFEVVEVNQQEGTVTTMFVLWDRAANIEIGAVNCWAFEPIPSD